MRCNLFCDDKVASNDDVATCLKEEYIDLLEEVAVDSRNSKRTKGAHEYILSSYLISACFLDPLKFSINDKVRNKFNLAGKILAVNETTRSYDILYNDGRSDLSIPESDIRFPPRGK